MLRAGERRHRQVRRTRRRSRFARAPRRAASSGLRLALRVLLAQPLLVLAVPRVELAAALRVEQVGDDADDPRRVEHVDRLAAVLRRDPHRRVLPRRRRAADQQRQVEPAPLHLARDVDHLVERRRDQPREPDDARALLDGGVEDAVGRHHHPEVDHLVVVAAEHDADDVLADVVDVALDGREHDAPRDRLSPSSAFSASMNGSR